eukprot:9481764-Pyramimonas_sp.AAC.1
MRKRRRRRRRRMRMRRRRRRRRNDSRGRNEERTNKILTFPRFPNLEGKGGATSGTCKHVGALCWFPGCPFDVVPGCPAGGTSKHLEII